MPIFTPPELLLTANELPIQPFPEKHSLQQILQEEESFWLEFGNELSDGLQSPSSQTMNNVYRLLNHEFEELNLHPLV